MEESKKRILITEDHVPTANALADTFTSEGFTVLKARDGEEGLGVALKERPDLILLDLKMPKMDGIAMLKKLRDEESIKNIPVIVLTNSIHVEKIAVALKGGVYDYLIKSDWTLEAIVKKVKEKFGL